MVTIAEIKAAHSRVKSGADFPAYIQDLKKLGVAHYETYVSDGHTIYQDSNGHQVASPASYAPLSIAETSDQKQFRAALKDHQEGKADYPTFCRDSAKSGIEKWTVAMDAMTCTYFDRAGKLILVEAILG